LSGAAASCPAFGFVPGGPFTFLPRCFDVITDKTAMRIVKGPPGTNPNAGQLAAAPDNHPVACATTTAGVQATPGARATAGVQATPGTRATAGVSRRHKRRRI